MLDAVLKLQLMALAEECKESRTRSTDAVASILYGILGVSMMNQEEALMNHVAIFTEDVLVQIRALRAEQEVEWLSPEEAAVRL